MIVSFRPLFIKKKKFFLSYVCLLELKVRIIHYMYDASLELYQSCVNRHHVHMKKSLCILIKCENLTKGPTLNFVSYLEKLLQKCSNV